MIDYSGWPKKLYNPFDLYFDPFNPRFPEDKQDKSQDEILTQLCEEYDVLTLVEQIKAIGFIPYEQPIGYFDKKEKKVYIIEGNRRLAAVRVLLDPNCAPGKIIDNVRRTSKEIGNKKPIEQLEIVIAPSREEAEPAILDKHIQDTKKGWTPLEQAVFSIKFMKKTGLSMTDIQKKYNISKSKFKDAISIDQLYITALKVKNWPLDFAEKIKKTGGKQGFSITNLHRYTIVKERLLLYGLERDVNGDLYLKIAPNEFALTFAKLIEDITNKDADSRNLEEWYEKVFPKFKLSINSPIQKRALIDIPQEEFWLPVESEAKNNPSQVDNNVTNDNGDSSSNNTSGRDNSSDTFNTNDNDNQNSPLVNNDTQNLTTSSTEDKKANTKKKKPVTNYIIEDDDPINCILHKKTQLIIEELKTLDAKKHVIGAALLLRTLIEIPTFVFLQKNNEIKIWSTELKSTFTLEAQNKRKALYNSLISMGVTINETDLDLNVRTLDKKTWPNLSAMLKRVCDKNLINDQHISDNVKSFMAKSGNQRFFQDLNEFVHNHASLPSFDDLKHIYNNFHPYLLKIIQ